MSEKEKRREGRSMRSLKTGLNLFHQQKRWVITEGGLFSEEWTKTHRRSPRREVLPRPEEHGRLLPGRGECHKSLDRRRRFCVSWVRPVLGPSSRSHHVVDGIPGRPVEVEIWSRFGRGVPPKISLSVVSPDSRNIPSPKNPVYDRLLFS